METIWLNCLIIFGLWRLSGLNKTIDDTLYPRRRILQFIKDSFREEVVILKNNYVIYLDNWIAIYWKSMICLRVHVKKNLHKITKNSYGGLGIAVFFMQVSFYMYKYICYCKNKDLKWMILKKKKLVVKEKYFNGYPCKNL